MNKVLVISAILTSFLATNAMAADAPPLTFNDFDIDQTINQVFYDCYEDAPCGQLKAEEIWMNSKHIRRVYK